MRSKRLIWQCPKCSDVVLSYNHLRHDMNTCDCGATSVDLEEHYMRTVGEPVVISEKVFENNKWSRVK